MAPTIPADLAYVASIEQAQSRELREWRVAWAVQNLRERRQH